MRALVLWAICLAACAGRREAAPAPAAPTAPAPTAPTPTPDLSSPAGPESQTTAPAPVDVEEPPAHLPPQPLIPLRPGERACGKSSQCRAPEQCQSPEEFRLNRCGMPHGGKCPKGTFGDACGSCFRACGDGLKCPKGFSCNGSMCISPRRCTAPQPPPP
jgi:hypothetical protein